MSAAAELPRAQSGPEPQRLLTVLLGDYWYWRTEAIPSQAIVLLLGEFGISDASARASMRRLTARGLVRAERNGRTTAYGSPVRANHSIIRHFKRIFGFGAESPAWDGQWTVVTFSVPEGERDTRRNLRDQLRLLGFGPLFDAVWVTPHDRTQLAVDGAREIGLDTVAVMRATIHGTPDSAIVGRAYDLDAIASSYHSFIETYGPVRERIRAGTITSRDALQIRTAVITDWRNATVNDPLLPFELLPADWPLARARACCVDVYDGLGELATQRFRQILSEVDPQLAALATHHTFADIAALPTPETEAEPPTEFDVVVDQHRLRSLDQRSRSKAPSRKPPPS